MFVNKVVVSNGGLVKKDSLLQLHRLKRVFRCFFFRVGGSLCAVVIVLAAGPLSCGDFLSLFLL